MDFMFILNSALLGVGLAMDAFSVSIANGLAEPKMRRRKTAIIAGTYAFFQFLMPLVGWFCVHTIVSIFRAFEPFVPYIALILLLFIGGKMIIGCFTGEEEEEQKRLGAAGLLVQGIATSIDALSVGFTIESYDFGAALAASTIIAAVTLIICLFGLFIGKKFGKIFSKAELLGGIILIFIGAEIFIKGVFFG